MAFIRPPGAGRERPLHHIKDAHFVSFAAPSHLIKERSMIRDRQGFTLIELLIVVVIIGILAAIAIPKFSATREKAYFSAMKSDLKNLQSQQEIYYSDPANNYSYASDIAATGLDFSASQGVTVGMNEGTSTGWGASATHAALDNSSQFCAVYVGDAASVSPATTPGVVTCTGE